MTKYNNEWEVPRTDKKNRCGICFSTLYITPKTAHRRKGNTTQLRFPFMCESCATAKKKTEHAREIADLLAFLEHDPEGETIDDYFIIKKRK